ncbi:uncharacterized protein B0T23DRAFT_145472 [Neurospora hispaniola]|uniref:Uncharacterized protein n=1 Tax=Neurospora hispaniola TaxID=588809 RepID=A0AAJ0MRF0_9PEZI|nr:hypothetical protein B0T23DRAFT_145472 [Neurospora hispaniola]
MARHSSARDRQRRDPRVELAHLTRHRYSNVIASLFSSFVSPPVGCYRLFVTLRRALSRSISIHYITTLFLYYFVVSPRSRLVFSGYFRAKRFDQGYTSVSDHAIPTVRMQLTMVVRLKLEYQPSQAMADASLGRNA